MSWDKRDLFLSCKHNFGQGYAVLIAFSVGHLRQRSIKIPVRGSFNFLVLLNFQNQSDKHSQNKTRLKSSYNPKYALSEINEHVT